MYMWTVIKESNDEVDVLITVHLYTKFYGENIVYSYTATPVLKK